MYWITLPEAARVAIGFSAFAQNFSSLRSFSASTGAWNASQSFFSSGNFSA